MLRDPLLNRVNQAVAADIATATALTTSGVISNQPDTLFLELLGDHFFAIHFERDATRFCASDGRKASKKAAP